MSTCEQDIGSWLDGAADAATRSRLHAAMADPATAKVVLAQYRVHRLLVDEPRVAADTAAILEQVDAWRARRRRRRIMTAAAFAAAALLVVALSWWWPGADGPPRPSSGPGTPLSSSPALASWGTLREVTGSTAPRLIDEAGRRRPLALGDAVYPGERLSVAPGSTATVRDGRGAIVQLAGGELWLAAADAAVVAELRRGRAAVALAADEQQRPWRLGTPHATVTITGTRFTVLVEAARTVVEVDEGTIRVDDHRTTAPYQLAAGESAVLGEEVAFRSGDLIAAWPCDGTDKVWIDDAGPYAIRAHMPPRTERIDGVAGGAILLDGNTTIGIDHHPQLEPASGTLCLWLRPTVAFAEQQAALASNLPLGIWEKMAWRQRHGYEILHPAHNEEPVWGLRLGHGNAVDDETSHAYTTEPLGAPGRWTHIAATWDDQRSRLYLDGRLVGEDTYTTPPIISSGKNVNVCGHFAGAVDDIRLYARALSPSEVRLVMHRPGERLGE